MIPDVLSSDDNSGLTIIAEADESVINFLYFELATNEMHPMDAF